MKIDAFKSAFRSMPAAVVFSLSVALAFSLIWLWSSGLKDVVTWAAVAFVLFNSIRRRERISFGGLGWPLLAYVIVCGISTLTSIDQPRSIRLFWKLIELIAGFTALVNLLRPGRRSDVATLVIAVAMIVMVLCDVVRLVITSHFDVQFLTDGRWSGSRYGFPTIAAAVHATGFVLCTALFLRARRTSHRIAIACALVLSGILLLHFQTRSVLLGIASGFLVLLLCAAKDRRKTMGALGVCAIALAVALAASPSFRGRILSGTFSERGGIWADAVQIIKVEPQMGKYFGVGYGHGIFLKMEKKIPKQLRKAKHILDHTHNMILEVLVETGWPGLAAWLVLLGSALRRFVIALRTAADERRWTLAALAATLVTLIIYGQFSAFFALAPFFIFWNFLAVLIAAASPPEKLQSLDKTGT